MTGQIVFAPYGKSSELMTGIHTDSKSARMRYC